VEGPKRERSEATEEAPAAAAGVTRESSKESLFDGVSSVKRSSNCLLPRYLSVMVGRVDRYLSIASKAGCLWMVSGGDGGAVDLASQNGCDANSSLSACQEMEGGWSDHEHL
jgi:hypothetical protein